MNNNNNKINKFQNNMNIAPAPNINNKINNNMNNNMNNNFNNNMNNNLNNNLINNINNNMNNPIINNNMNGNITNNNINQQINVPIMSNYDNSVNSSDAGETIDDDKSNLSMAPNAQMYQINNLPVQNMIPNNQNDNLFINNMNNNNNKKVILTKKNLENLKNKLSTKITKKNGYNIQIPIEFISGNNYNNINNNNFGSIDEFNKLNHFIRISNTPTLCLDLTDKSYELELKLQKLKNQLNEKKEEIKSLESQKIKSENELNDKKLFLNRKEEELSNLKKISIEYDNQINDLITQKNELITKIPETQNPIFISKRISRIKIPASKI